MRNIKKWLFCIMAAHWFAGLALPAQALTITVPETLGLLPSSTVPEPATLALLGLGLAGLGFSRRKGVQT